MIQPTEERPLSREGKDSLVRVCIGLGLWCAGLTVFATTSWIRTYEQRCMHEQIFHNIHGSLADCQSLLSSGGVLRTGTAFFELLLWIAVIVLPLVVIGPVLLRALRARS